MSDTTVYARNLGRYSEHPNEGSLIFSKNGLLFFGGQTYRSVSATTKLDGSTSIDDLESRIGALETRADRLQDRVVVLEDGPDDEDEDDTPLVENVPRPRFSKDDRVVYIAPADFCGRLGVDVASRPDGTLGTVLEDSNGEAGVRVQWEEADHRTMTSVEFVQPAPLTTKFLVHDVVEIGQSVYESVEPGTWGIVRGVIPVPGGGWVYSVEMPRRSFLFNEGEIRGKVS